jgi:hypothetical protein
MKKQEHILGNDLEAAIKEDILSRFGLLSGKIAKGGIESSKDVVVQIRNMITIALDHGIGLQELVKACRCYGTSTPSTKLFRSAMRSLRDVWEREGQNRAAMSA